MIDEKEMILRIKGGDEKAFHDLYEKYAGYALRAAAAVMRDRAGAADAVQEAFVRVYRNIDSFDIEMPFKPWFYKILMNECRRLMKNRFRTVSLSEYLESNPGEGEPDQYDFEEYEELRKAVRKLKEIYRIPLVLKYLNDFTESQIADILELNVNTVKSRLFKGRKKLKEVLEKLDERRMTNG